MTREEAIRELKADYCGNRIICELHPDQCNREDCEIWLAIKALAEQPIRVLETQPEIIMCKDCKHFILSNASNRTVCNKYNGLICKVEGTDFCSRAKRRTDGN